MRIETFALAALVPMMIGPLPSAGKSITAQLCGGGSITIPLKGDDRQLPPQPCFKGCHAGGCRKRGSAD